MELDLTHRPERFEQLDRARLRADQPLTRRRGICRHWPTRTEALLMCWERARLDLARYRPGSDRYEHALADAVRCAEEYVSLQSTPPPTYAPLEHEASDASLRAWLVDEDRDLNAGRLLAR